MTKHYDLWLSERGTFFTTVLTHNSERHCQTMRKAGYRLIASSADLDSINALRTDL